MLEHQIIIFHKILLKTVILINLEAETFQNKMIKKMTNYKRTSNFKKAKNKIKIKSKNKKIKIKSNKTTIMIPIKKTKIVRA